MAASNTARAAEVAALGAVSLPHEQHARAPRTTLAALAHPSTVASPSHSGGAAAIAGVAVPLSERLWIGNWPREFGEAELNTVFSPFGALQQATVLRDKYPATL